MQYTSGTTGRPKAVQRTLPSFDPETWVQVFSGNLLRYDIEPGGDAVHLVTSPMYHMSPLSFGYFSAHFEHPVVLMEKWDAEEALRLVARYRVTDTAMVPTQLHRLMQLPEQVRAGYDVSSLRQVIHAAAPCPIDLKRKLFDWLGPVIYEFYGATEGGGTLATPQDWLAHPGTVGRPWQGADVKVLDDEGNEVPAGTVGTVFMKLMGGDFRYKGDPDKTDSNRRGDLFTVGDMGELDADGFLYLRDRKIDMIISGGVNVYPAEVEAALLSHPAVGDAAVFGIPDEDWGEQVKAVVEPVPGATASLGLAEELLAHCASQLATYKCPRSIEFTEAMPRDPNGKLYKRRLRDPYWERSGRDL
jgi:long-chain acyl-CoA synthetase